LEFPGKLTWINETPSTLTLAIHIPVNEVPKRMTTMAMNAARMKQPTATAIRTLICTRKK
jgi:hypothetical protein